MYFFKVWVRKGLLLVLAIWGILFFYKIPLPSQEQIEKEIISYAPIQNETNQPVVKMNFKGFDYAITPLYSYDIRGLVVAEYSSDNFLDFYHKTDPANTRDLCLVWGKTIENGAYQEVKYSHGEFTCYYKWTKPPKNSFDFTQLSNNHLLPINEKVAKAIKQAGIGDQVRIRGWLAKYEISQNGELIGSRGTSTIRTDTGNGACETILVDNFEILKANNVLYKKLKQISIWVVCLMLIANMALAFVPAEPKTKVKITLD